VCESSSSTGFKADKVEIPLLTTQDDLLESGSNSKCSNDCDVESKSHTVPICLSELKYRDISFRERNEPITCLEDNGAQISVIKEELIEDLDLPAVGTITIKGIVGQPVIAQLVRLSIKPCPGEGCENTAPYLSVVFAACKMSTDVDVILCNSVIKELNELNAYNILVTDILPVEAVTSDIYEYSEITTVNQTVSAKPDEASDISPQMVIDNNQESFLSKQVADESLKNAWTLAANGKGNFYVHDGLLYHHDKVLGQKVNQLCLPRSKIKDACQLAHGIYHQGIKRTKEKIRSHFFWENMNKTVQEYVNGCLECQLKARPLVKDRVLISVIPRDHEPFYHLYMDIIGPLGDNLEYK